MLVAMNSLNLTLLKRFFFKVLSELLTWAVAKFSSSLNGHVTYRRKGMKILILETFYVWSHSSN